jgi:hypothetical protein
MYKVRYYMAGSNTRVCKIFKTFSEAVEFSNTKVGINEVYEIVKVD